MKPAGLLLTFLALLPSSCMGPDHGARAVDLERDALAGDQWAMFGLGEAFEQGLGVDKNFAESMRYYRMAADQDLPVAQNRMGNIREAEENFVTAALWYRKAAALDHADAATNLGSLYERGAGVPLNRGLAAHFYERGAELGSPRGMLNLGLLKLEGQPGLEGDFVEAYKWFDLARWWTSTPYGGDQLVGIHLKALDDLRPHMTGEEIIEAETRAAAWVDAYSNSAFKSSEPQFN